MKENSKRTIVLLIRVWIPLSSECILKPLPSECILKPRGKAEEEKSKMTIYASGELRLLQIVLELDIGQCASENVRPPKRVDFEIPH